MNENLNSSRPNPDDTNDEWSSFMKESNDRIEENYARDLSELQALRDQQLAENKAYSKKLQKIKGRTATEYSEDYSGERNFLNGDPTKKRSFSEMGFSEMDAYPIQKGETPRQYGDRLKRAHDFTALTELLPKEPDETAEEYSQRIASIYNDFPRHEGESYANYQRRMQSANEDGSILEHIVERNIDAESEIGKNLRDDLLNIEDMQKSGRFDEARARVLRREVTEKALHQQREHDRAEARALQREDMKKALHQQKEHGRDDVKHGENENIGEEPENGNSTQAEDEARARAEEEERARAEEEERARAEEEERSKEEQEALENRIDELAEIASEKEAEKTAFEEKIKELHEIASEKEAEKTAFEEKIKELHEIASEKRAEKAGPLAAINADFTVDRNALAHDYAERELNEELSHSGWIKKIWKGSVFKKYYQKKYETEMLSGDRKVSHNGEKATIDDIIEQRSDSAIKRFVMGVTEDYGKSFIHTKAGEKLNEADARTTAAVKEAIEWYANAKIPEDGSAEEIRALFGEKVGRFRAESRDNDKPINEKLIDNYFEVAEQARERVEHGVALERVMEGFKVYNADVRNSIRSEAHRDNIDKIINKLEESRIGSIVSSPALAAALTSAWGLTQMGSRAVLGPVIGIGASGVLAGAKERNRVTEDRTRMMRDAAVNARYDGTLAENPKGAREKYEAKLGGTIYDMRPASELTDGLNQAMASGDRDSIMKAIAEARVRIDYSDSENKDLISYSSGDHIGDERLKLDIALIRAEKSLSDEDKSSLALAKEAVQNHINDDVDEEDKNFRRIRTAQAVKQARKTVLTGTVFFFASQEIRGFFDPNTVNIFEKAGIVKNSNPNATRETLLAGISGPRGVNTQTISNVSGNDVNKIRSYRRAGFKQIETKKPWTETKQDLIDIKPKKSPNRVKAIYDGWADNGTKVSDGNELGIQVHKNAIVANMSGKSTMNGNTFDVSQLAKNNQIKGFITMADGSKFEVASQINSSGQMSFPIDAKGFVTTTTGESIKAIGKNGGNAFKYFEVAIDNGVDAKGFRHMIPLATELGKSSYTGTIKQVVETSVNHPGVYSFVKEVPRELWWGGVTAPISSRTNIGGVTEPEPVNTPTPTGEPTPVAPTPEPIPTPEPTPNPEPTPEPISTPSETAPSPDPSPDNTPAPTGEPTPVAPTPEPTPNPEPTPEPTPIHEPAPTPVEPESDNTVEEPTTTESSPETNSEQEATENQEDSELNDIRERFVNTVGEDGLSIMLNREGFNEDIDNERFANWWNSLPEDAQAQVLEYIPTLTAEGYALALGTWLQNQGRLSPGPLPESTPVTR